MTNQQVVDKQIEAEYDKFYNSVYAGKVDVPSDILEKFKKGIMSIPPFAHKINFLKIKNVASKSPNQLTNGDLNEVVKIILSTVPSIFYASFNEATKGNIEFEKFVLCYNDFIDDFTKSLQMKKATLMELSGVSVMDKKRMSIVN